MQNFGPKHVWTSNYICIQQAECKIILLKAEEKKVPKKAKFLKI